MSPKRIHHEYETRERCHVTRDVTPTRDVEVGDTKIRHGIIFKYLYTGHSPSQQIQGFLTLKNTLFAGRSSYERQSATVAAENNARTGLHTIDQQDKAVDIGDAETADGLGDGLIDRGRAVIVAVLEAAALLAELQDLVVLQAASCNTDRVIARWDDIGVPGAVLDVGEPHTTAVATFADGEHTDADGGGGLAESNLGTGPVAGRGLVLESEATAGDGDCVGGDF